MRNGIGPQNLGASGMSTKSKPCGSPLKLDPATIKLAMTAVSAMKDNEPDKEVEKEEENEAVPKLPGSKIDPSAITKAGPLYNAGTMYLKKEAAKAAGKDSFNVGGKTFPVQG
tara:strand:+ start:436 stop:774 length:339 start_codon:yes stop_codon:yes gene_type:complete